MSIELADGFKVQLLQAKVSLLNSCLFGLAVNRIVWAGTTTLDDVTQYMRTPSLPYRYNAFRWGPAFPGPPGLGQLQTNIGLLVNPLGLTVQCEAYFFVDPEGFLAFGDNLAPGAFIAIGGSNIPKLFRVVMYEDSLRGL